nr:PREDICTED: uncharacterized protein LOC106703846 [Latimeria chalumnae]|eukprot:XP_014344970.1 PREDICTED: uncharacterized protein LOC106703846 [Latimeria chalumnae]
MISEKSTRHSRDRRHERSSGVKHADVLTHSLPLRVYRNSSPAVSGTIHSNRNFHKIFDLNSTLDQAIKTANSMKRTSERIVKSLSADLTTAEYLRNLQLLDQK